MAFEIICFDCDSTLSKIEGIDELAKRAGMGSEMAKLTDAAMNGEVPLEAVYERRLSLIRPHQDSISWLSELYVAEMVAGVADVFARLHEAGKTVHIISGGLRQAILPLAAHLGVADSHVHAVDIFFNPDGSYQNFDTDSPLARNGGKAEVCQRLGKGAGAMVMVGDGKTDMEAKQAGAYVLGFGGVVDRPIVRDLADFYSTETNLLWVLEKVL
ncbi:MAG: HAD-IB family phosphatase [Methylococcaceae bacterium]|nr:HAD-IB family phosphatase [Methylococcaceae bacterium]